MKVVFLDRDGVINNGGANDFVNARSDFRFIPDSLRAIRLLTEHQWRIFVVTNQGGIEAGFLTESALSEIHNHMLQRVAETDGHIERVYHCPHTAKTCPNRKPNPGMLLSAKKEFDLDFNQAYMVGDYTTDIQAALNAGVVPIHVKTGRGRSPECIEMLKANPHIKSFENLYEATYYLIYKIEEL